MEGQQTGQGKALTFFWHYSQIPTVSFNWVPAVPACEQSFQPPTLREFIIF
jgi:hypothetical protein